MARILHVMNTADYAGAGYYGFCLARVFHAAGHFVHIDTYPGGEVEKRCLARGIPHTGQLDLRHFNPLKFLGEYQWLKNFIREHSIEVVYGHQNQGYWCIALAARDAGATPIRIRADEQRPKSHPLNFAIFNRWSDGFIATSPGVLRECAAVLHLDPRFMEAIPAPFIPPSGGDHPQPPKNTNNFALVARFSPVKGHDFLLETLAKMNFFAMEAGCDLIGRPCDWEGAEMARRVQESELSPRVKVLGEQPDILQTMGNYGFGLICSLGSEVNSRVALEWGWAGRMVIATRVGVLPWLIEDGVDGILVPPGDKVALARAISWALANPEEVRRRGARWRAKVLRNYDPETFYCRHLAFLERAMARHRKGKRGVNFPSGKIKCGNPQGPIPGSGTKTGGQDKGCGRQGTLGL